MADDHEATSDFLVFHLGAERDGIIRSEPNDEEEEPSLIRYVDSHGTLSKISENRPLSLSPSPQMPRKLSDPHRISQHQTTPDVLSDDSDLDAKYLQTPSGDIKSLKNHRATPSIDDAEWQSMDTVGSSVLYNDNNEQLVKLREELEDGVENANSAASGYTRVFVDNNQDSDNESIDSMDKQTDFLFDNNLNDLSESRSTAALLTDGQKIAYASLFRVTIANMTNHLREYGLVAPLESMQKWQVKSSLGLYTHLGLSNEEQMMVEQLSDHGVLGSDLAEHLKITQTKLPSGEFVEIKSDLISESEIKCAPVTGVDEKNLVKQAISIDVRWTVICDLFLNLVVDGSYDARSRALLMNFAKELDVEPLDVARFERKVTDAMQIDEDADQKWEDEALIEQRRKVSLKKKYAYMGAATIGGGLVIGLSAGLLAPVIGAGLAAGFTTIGIAGTTGFLAGAGGAALVTTTGVAVGARAGLMGMSRRMGHVRTFEFRPLHNNARVNLILTVSGWMTGKEDDVRLPFSTVDPVMGDLLSLYWEPEMMQSMGQTINILATEALTQSVQQLLGATVLTALMASLQLPMALSKLSYLLDNPWNVSLDRAWSAGLIMADAIAAKHLGNRPITLVGFSLGARVIYSCLVELAKRGAYGLIQDVYVFGTPVTIKKKQFLAARSVVSGRFVSGYSTRDWILGYLFRATSGGIGSVLGLAPIDLHEVENLDVTELVDGHMSYRNCMPKLLKLCGWLVLGDEFEEIEDPDPEKLREKQRKLIAELHDENLEKQPSRFARFFGFGTKQDWLQAAQKSETASTSNSNEEFAVGSNDIFNVDALRAEVHRLESGQNAEMMFDIDDPDEQVLDEQGEAHSSKPVLVSSRSTGSQLAFEEPSQVAPTLGSPLGQAPPRLHSLTVPDAQDESESDPCEETSEPTFTFLSDEDDDNEDDDKVKAHTMGKPCGVSPSFCDPQDPGTVQLPVAFTRRQFEDSVES